ncbi:MAG: type II toxin-antitoxin system death-on-curing family toxin [Polyangiaceae bacterium]
MRLDDILFLDVDDVRDAHAVGIARFGGSAGLRDRGLLESAVMAPRSGYYCSLAELASVYAHGIAKNHPFVDGNKRAALIAAGMFLNVHGFDLDLGMEWVGHIEELAAGKLSRVELVVLFAVAMGEDVPVES